MFVAVNAIQEPPTMRVDRWAAAAWPGGTRSEGHGWTIWTDGRSHQTPYIDAKQVVVVDGVIWNGSDGWCAGTASLLAGEVDRGWPLPASWDGSFAVAVLKPGSAKVAVDPSGLRRCCWARESSGLVVVSSLQLPVAVAIRAEADLAGVAETLVLGRTLGQRSLFVGCRDLWPGSCLHLHSAGSSVVGAVESPVLPGHEYPEMDLRNAAESLVPLLRTSAARAYDAFNSPAIALSGGVDSRLVLGALLPDRMPSAALSYGDPHDADVRIAARLANAVGLPHHVVDLRGRLFPSLEDARQDSIERESLWHPAWLSVNPVIEENGWDSLLMGDVTDSLQVRVGALWDRRARVQRQIRRMTQRGNVESTKDQLPVDQWWGELRDSLLKRLVAGVERNGIPIERGELVSALEEDLEAIWCTAGLAGFESALDAEDAIQIAAARQQAGIQVAAIGGGAVGQSVFGSRGVVKAARSLGLELRADRALLRELCLQLLPPELGRVPTATIPVVPTTSRMGLQNAMWFSRFSADWILRRANRLARGRLPRERLVKTLELPSEYRAAGADCFLAHDWASSGTFGERYLSARYLDALSGNSIPMIPLEHYVAVRVDTLVGWSTK